MSRIAIIDHDSSAGAMLKIALERELFQVCLLDDWYQLRDDPQRPAIDLVLIRQAPEKCSAWRQFNRFKQEISDIPAMIYVLPDYQWSSIDWIVQAAKEVFKASPSPDAADHSDNKAQASPTPA